MLWAVFTWPLPRYMDRAIPYGSQSYGSYEVCSMTAGDHLQYLYYLALFTDMLTGHTPWFSNIYEFNTGDDAARIETDVNFFPVSLVFAVIALVSNLAMAWNLTGLISIWLSCWLTWMLVRRYVDHEWLAALASIATLALPFRWANLLGGSTMGPALVFIPLIMLGLDLAIRENKIRGGVYAGLALFFALSSDMHAFFFGSLLVPGWCVVALIKKEDFHWGSLRSYLRLVPALLPVPLFLFGAVALKHAVSTAPLVAEKSRTWNEAALFSPYFKGVFGMEMGVTGHIYIGSALALMTLLVLVAVVIGWQRRCRIPFDVRNALVALCLIGGVVVILLLALGTYGPNGGKLFDLARKYMPFYSNIRQSAKIFGLMPPVLSVLIAVGYVVAVPVFRRTTTTWLWLLLCVWFVAASYRHVAIAMTWLDLDQGAYAAVAEDSAARNQRPGAVVVPLWPGDSHFSSAYQMHSLTYRIRMINGYRPSIRAAYREDVATFSSVNQGVLSDEQIDELLSRGIHYVLLHENVFPEPVSPFPVGQTLRRLLNHPRLELLTQDERVWSFRLLEEPVEKEILKPEWSYAFPTRRQEAEAHVTSANAIVREDSAGAHAFVRLTTNVTITGRMVPVAASPDLAWLVRSRGQGVIAVTPDAPPSVPTSIAVNAPEWSWIRIPIPSTNEFLQSSLSLQGISGEVDVDMMILVDGTFPTLAPGDAVELGAARFFHVGYMDFSRETVTLEKGIDPRGVALYGPKWPMEPGRYEIEVIFDSPAPAGTSLGVFNLEQDDATGAGVALELISGKPARGLVNRADNLPFKLVLVFLGEADVTVEKVVIRRLP